MNQYVLVFCAGLVAGSMNALAGGGSFVTLPALISIGIPSVQANATSTVGLYPGTAASAWAYRDSLRSIGSVSLQTLLLAALVGGAIGALLLLWTPTKIFDVVLPWLLLIATLTLAFGRQLGEWLRRRWHIGPSVVLLTQLVLGIYGGYFGGAVGIMMVAVWGLLDSSDPKSLNAPRTLLVTAANTIAVLIFIAAGAVRWREAVVMLIGASIGGYCGALLGRRASSGIVRGATLLIAAAITVLFFVRVHPIGR